MTSPDAPFLELTANLTPLPLAPAILAARTEIREAVSDLSTIRDSDLTTAWKWPALARVQARFAFFRAYEVLELAAAEAEAALAGGPARRPVVRVIGPATATRWDLHGLLRSVTDADWDADPGGGEWSIRRTVTHIIGGQRSFAWGTAWWVGQGMLVDDPALPEIISADITGALPSEATVDIAGSRTEAGGRIDAILDLSTERLSGLPDDKLALGSRYAGSPVSVAFRLGRWSSHIREHTIQVEKTLAMLDRPPTEADRLIRLVLAAYGRLEAVVFGLSAADGAAASAVVARAVGDVREIATSAAASASAATSEGSGR